MKSDRLSIRVTEEEKKEICLEADKYSMSTSEYVVSAVKEKMEVDKINDSQSKFLKLFDVAFQKAFDPYFKRIMVINNRIEFNTRWQLKQQDIFMQHLKVPQNKEDLNISIIPHPLTEVAEEQVLKDIRTMASKKRELDNE
mgnify:FL=1